VLLSAIPTLEAAVVGRRIQKLSEGSLTPEKLTDLTEFLRGVRRARLRVDPTVLREVGTKIAQGQEREGSPEALAALSEIGGYKSTVAPLPPSGDYFPPGGFSFTVPSTRLSPWVLEASGHAPLAEAARFELLDDTFNDHRLEGPALTELKPDTDAKYERRFTIDGMWIKKSIINNAYIYYSGDRVRLENVTFNNCWFNVERTEEGSRFVSEIASAPPGPVTFLSGV
jgi:hypothetical protein